MRKNVLHNSSYRNVHARKLFEKNFVESKINRRNPIRRKKPEMERNVVQNGRQVVGVHNWRGRRQSNYSLRWFSKPHLSCSEASRQAPENAETGGIGRRSLSVAANHLLIETTFIIYSWTHFYDHSSFSHDFLLSLLIFVVRDRRSHRKHHHRSNSQSTRVGLHRSRLKSPQKAVLVRKSIA